jgi:hypothetical protein
MINKMGFLVIKTIIQRMVSKVTNLYQIKSPDIIFSFGNLLKRATDFRKKDFLM